MANLRFIYIVLFLFILSSLITDDEAFSSNNRVGKRKFKVNICYFIFHMQGSLNAWRRASSAEVLYNGEVKWLIINKTWNNVELWRN